MSKLTGTHLEASEIDFTTLTTVPGTLKVHGAPIQILDLRAYLVQPFRGPPPYIFSHPQRELLKEQTTVEVEVDKVRASSQFIIICPTADLDGSTIAVIAGAHFLHTHPILPISNPPLLPTCQLRGHVISFSSCSTC